MKVRIGFMISGVGSSEMKTNLSLKKKALPTTFLPSVKTLTKNILLFFLLAQVFFFVKKEKVFCRL